MRIRRLRVEGFGRLKGDFIFSSDRCNLILEPNESGKSTLASAILAALYGFPRERASRDRPITMKERHRPWNGGRYALEIELECRERTYVVRRDFDNDAASVFDGQTGRDITAEFSRSKDHLDFGESLTGLTREDFARSCFVGQREIEGLRDAAGLTHALQRIASSQQGDVVAGEAIEALNRAVERDYEGMRLGRGKVDTEIKRLEKEIDEVRAEMEAIAARRRQSEGKIARLEEATDREGVVEGHLARADHLCLLAAHREVESALKQLAREEEEVEAYRAEAATLAPFAGFPADKLGELRELKGKIESLEERRGALQRRLIEETVTPLAEAEASLAPLAVFESLDDMDASLASDRLAVIGELWSLRREKRRALRQEERRLTAAGIEPGQVKVLASKLSGLSEEDRSFLSGYREKLLEVKAALSEAERDRDRLLQAEGGESPALVSLAAARRAEVLSLGACFLGIVLTVLLFFTLPSKLPLIGTGLLAAGGFIWWLRLLEKRPLPGAEEFGSDLQRTQTVLWAREKEQAALQERLMNVAARVSYGKPDRLVEEYRALESLQEKAAPLTALASSVREVQNRYDAAAQELLDLMNRSGRPPVSRLVTPRVARRFRDDVARYIEGRRRVGALRAALETGSREVSETLSEIDALRGSAASLLGSALGGDGPWDDLGAALARFEDAAARRERLDRLTLEILPSAQRRHEEAPAQRAARLARERDVLSRQIERAAKADPSLEGLTPVKSSRDYAEERRQLQEEARQTQRDRQLLSEELGDVLKEYRRDYPTRQEMLGRLEAALARATAFRDAVALAAGALTSISKEAYAEWAEVLNDRTSEILRRLNPNYEDVRFDTDLSFTLRDARTGQRLDRAAVEAHLSSGARDQVYLAARMAAAEYLSTTGMRLPFVLDDPFAAFDDERFDRAMEFLLDTLGRRHQIVILSCHAARHRRWQEMAPGQLADRMRILDLTPLST